MIEKDTYVKALKTTLLYAHEIAEDIVGEIGETDKVTLTIELNPKDIATMSIERGGLNIDD